MVRCNENGKEIELTPEEALKKFYAAHYAWDRKNNLYRYNIDGFSGSSQIYSIVGSTAMTYSFLVHTMDCPVTIIDMGRHKKLRTTDTGIVVPWASKFHIIIRRNPKFKKKIHEIYYPLQFLELPDSFSAPLAAFCRHPDRDYFVIL